MLGQTPQGTRRTTFTAMRWERPVSTMYTLYTSETGTHGLVLVLDPLVLLDLEQVLLPRRKRLEDKDLARGMVRVSLGERLLDDGSRREPSLGQVRQLGQELGSGQGGRVLELGL